jgi:hypothetical protein
MTLYQLSEDFGRSFRATLDSADDADFGKCLRAEIEIPKQLKFRWKMGAKTPGHLVWTDDWTILLSDQLRRRLRACSGWSSTRVTLLLPTLKPAGSYHLLSISGRCGAFLPHRTEKLPAAADRAWDMCRGLCFEPGAGAPDLCMPNAEVMHILVSENAASVFRELCDNATLTACADILTRGDTFDILARKFGRSI